MRSLGRSPSLTPQTGGRGPARPSPTEAQLGVTALIEGQRVVTGRSMVSEALRSGGRRVAEASIWTSSGAALSGPRRTQQRLWGQHTEPNGTRCFARDFTPCGRCVRDDRCARRRRWRGVHYRTLRRRVSWYRTGGLEEVRSHRMKGLGQPRFLSEDQERELTEEVGGGRFRMGARPGSG